MAHVRTSQELEAALLEQLNFLKDSCLAYDRGNSSEAKRMSVILRILLFDPTPRPNAKGPSRSRSLLTQIGIKDTIQYFSLSGKGASEDSLMFNCFNMVFKDSVYSFAPNLSVPESLLSFQDWFNAIISVGSEVKLTRELLIRSVADTDGGAHIDNELDGSYAVAVNDRGKAFMQIGTRESVEGGKTAETKPIPNQPKVELILLRQISHEILCTFDKTVGSVKKVDYLSQIPSVTLSEKRDELIATQDEDQREIEIQKLTTVYGSTFNVEYEKSTIYYRTGKYNKAKIITETLSKSHPNNSVLSTNYSLLITEIFDSPEKIVSHFIKALAAEPDNSLYHYQIAQAYKLLENYTAHIAHAKRAIEIAPENAVYQAAYALCEKSSEAAKERFEYAIKLNPNIAFIHYNLAVLLLKYMNDPETAKKYYSHAITLDLSYKSPEKAAMFGLVI